MELRRDRLGDGGVPAADLGAFPAAADNLKVAVIGAGLDEADFGFPLSFRWRMAMAVGRAAHDFVCLRRLDHPHRLLVVLFE